MSVDLEPNELGFKRPFTTEVSQTLRLHNPNNDAVAFKVKTTAPKQYCVRPNSGRIDAGQDVEVQVLLQAMKEDPPPDTKCRDKFLVQSVAIKADAGDNITSIWSNIEQNAKTSIQEKKIRVTFLPVEGSGTTASSGNAVAPAAVAAGGAAAGGAAATAATTNGVTEHHDEPSSYGSPTPPTSTPVRTVTEKSPAQADTPSTATALGGSWQNQNDLQAQLDEAKAEIKRLQAQMAESVRQRKPQEVASAAMESVQQSLQNAPAPGGVPIQITAGLCLFFFILAWLLF